MAHLFIKTITLISLIAFASGQHNQSNDYSQKGKSEYLIWKYNISDRDASNNNSVFSRIINKLIGAESNRLAKPVSIIISGSNQAYILSRESGGISFWNDGRFKQSPKKEKDLQKFSSLVDGCLIPEKRLLLTDSYDSVVYILNNNSNWQIFNGALSLNRPTGIDYSSISNTVWVAETGGHCLAEFTPDGKLLRRIGKRGAGPLEFNFPTHLCIDKIYIVDAMNFRVQILDQDGNFISEFGEAGNASGKIARPKGIDTDSEGNIYLVDALFNAIQVFNNKGQLLYYFGRKGSENGEFVLPSGIAIDENDYIYVADTYNNRIQVFKKETNQNK